MKATFEKRMRQNKNNLTPEESLTISDKVNGDSSYMSQKQKRTDQKYRKDRNR